MSDRIVTLSGEVLDRIFEHVSATGRTLLNDWRRGAALVEAWEQEDGWSELVDEELNSFLNGCESYEDFAAFYGQGLRPGPASFLLINCISPFPDLPVARESVQCPDAFRPHLQ